MFQAVLKPGFHQFAIYDPLSDRVFVKEFVLDLNNEFIPCPELPRTFAESEAPKPKYVWLPWKQDSDDACKKAIELDSMSGNFDMELFIKERTGHAHYNVKEAHELILKHLMKAFPAFIVFLKEGMANSKGFPELDHSAFMKLANMVK